jgi:hypothetical protein
MIMKEQVSKAVNTHGIHYPLTSGPAIALESVASDDKSENKGNDDRRLATVGGNFDPTFRGTQLR